MTEAVPARPRLLSFLPAFLFRNDVGAAGYVLRAWPVALIPTMLLGIFVGLLAPEAQAPAIAVQGWFPFVMVVFGAPAIETLLMAPPLLLLARFLRAAQAAIGSALLWAVLHSLAAPAWGLVIWWPFLILSVAMLTWRERGVLPMLAIVAAIHALHNSVPAALMLLAMGASA